MEKNKVYLKNWFEFYKEIPDNFIDLIICDGPYGITQHPWDKVKHIQRFNFDLITQFTPKLKDGGTLYLFGKSDCIDFIEYRQYLTLKNKIVWYTPARLSQGKNTYTNNYDIICYFVKGKEAKTFNLDDIRVHQVTELTHRKRCENVPSVVKGKFKKTKYNEKGKNPGDVWGDIKQLTYKSNELVTCFKNTLHTIQKPQELIRRLVKASSNKGDLVLDPFAGIGTVGKVCIEEERDYILVESDPARHDFIQCVCESYKCSKEATDELFR